MVRNPLGEAPALRSSVMFTGRAIEGELVDAHANSQLGAYLRGLWHRQAYGWYVAEADLRQRQITTVFGSLWHLLNPVLSIAVYFLVFGVILETDRGVDGRGGFLLFLTVGLFVFQYTQRAVTQGALSIVANRGLIQAIRFPRAMLPLSACLTETFAALPTFLVVIAVALATESWPTWSWLALPLIVAWQMLFNAGLALVAARITTHFRDMQQLLPFAFRLLIYASGVFFSVEDYVSDLWLELLFYLNPVYGFISMARWSVMGIGVPPQAVIMTAGWTLLVVVGGFLWFKAAEHTYDRV